MDKKIKIIIVVFVITILIGGIYFFIKEDKNTSLTVMEKRWIENNKDKVIDIAIINDVPIVSNSGSGIIYDFLSSLENDTGLEINKLPYNKTTKTNYEYALAIKEDVQDDILLYQDNYVIVTKEKLHYNNITEIKNLRIGTLTTDLTKISNYLSGSTNLTYQGYESYDEMISDVKNKKIDGIVLPKLDYLETILSDELNIAYNITEYTKNYVITLGSDAKLNKILTKYFNNYKNNKYEKSINKHFMNSYFTFNNIDDKEQARFRSKRYKYGFVLNAPFEVNINGSLKGLNYSLIKKFTKMANVEIEFKRYSSIQNILNDFNQNNLDLIYGDIDQDNFSIDVVKTVSAYDNQVAIITKDNTDVTLNNIYSLSGKTISTIKNSYIESHLKKNNIKVKSYNNSKDLLNDLKGTKIAAIDEYTYDYYVRSGFKDIKKIGTLDFEYDYGFINRDISDNEIFNEFFNFYLSFNDNNNLTNESYINILNTNNHIIVLQTLLSALVIVLVSFTTFLAFKIFKHRKTYSFKLSKADKLRYIDSMTSLKNRDYLNDNIAKWDSSEIYPQSVIIIDLNNIAYINDNFGHTEGDKVIVEGASILINNQLSDSELVRTDGNEFLVFTIGHDEKTIVTYMRKLNKEFKDLSHGFGAAIGYSMIHDEIKTIDDAINEATIDMRNNKEERNN